MADLLGSDIYSMIANSLNVSKETVIVLLLLMLTWKLFWYGIAFYKTIERKQIQWFVGLFIGTFILNDLGLLAIVYLIIYKNKPSNKKQDKNIKTKSSKKKSKK